VYIAANLLIFGAKVASEWPQLGGPGRAGPRVSGKAGDPVRDCRDERAPNRT
jgi:hypothetical protein